MYLLYLDDSGSPDDPTQEHFVLGGICLLEKKSYWINKHLDELAEKVDSEHPQFVEFHASEIFGGRTVPWKKFNRPERIEIIKSTLGVAVREARDTALFACAVHKPSFPNHDPVEVAFEDLCSRFERFLNRVYAEKKESHQGLIILDKSAHETSLQHLARDFRKKGTKWGVTKNICEVPLFVDSKASRSIQLADHIAYSVFRRYEAADLNYFNVIQGCFDSDEERIHGLVHKQFLMKDCTCPSCLTRGKAG